MMRKPVFDLDVLRSLPPREFNQGFAEVIKHGVIADSEMFEALRKKRIADGPELQELVKRNIEIKARIIAEEFARAKAPAEVKGNGVQMLVWSDRPGGRRAGA